MIVPPAQLHGGSPSPGHTLAAIYSLYAQWVKPYAFACRKGCAACCTRSVTMTTLEGEMISAYLAGQRPDLLSLLDDLPDTLPTTGPTTNQFAAACLRGEELPEEPGHWDFTPCIFLYNGSCAIYPVRPFMCRSFGSRVRCKEGGEAEIEPLLLTLNTVIMQCIEHLDQGRPWGNMNSLLRRITAHAEKEGTGYFLAEKTQSLPIPGFLLLPEERIALREQIAQLMRLLNGKEAG